MYDTEFYRVSRFIVNMDFINNAMGRQGGYFYLCERASGIGFAQEEKTRPKT